MEGLTRLQCNVCGAPLDPSVLRGGVVRCGCCDSVFAVSDRSVERERLERAYELIRGGRFSDAEDVATGLIKSSGSYEAYWVRALAKNGVIFVRDIGDKMVPTCQNITTAAFEVDPDVKRAAELAPSDIAENYRTQAARIEAIRKEWLETARKEPPYDVFICYKDSDKENGIERTRDSEYAHSVYNYLQDKGLRVFYSRVSLMGKVSEHYEPYIYGALTTAKVMLVYGEKAEYFSATWVKNEWSRYITRMQRENRPATSLIVGYKGVDPYRIPSALLGGRQALDLSDPAAFTVLVERIIQAVDISKRPETLERRQVQGGQIAKKATSIVQEQISTRSVGGGTVAKLNFSLESKLSMVKQYLAQRMWRDASANLGAVLSEAPQNGEALICKLLVDTRCATVDDIKGLSSFDRTQDVVHILNVADKSGAVQLLRALYAMDGLGDGSYAKLMEAILPYDFDGRAAAIDALMQKCIKKGWVSVFNVLIKTLASTEVDKYITLNSQMAVALFNMGDRARCQGYIDAVLKIDEGNNAILRLYCMLALADHKSVPDFVSRFERLLRFSKDANAQVQYFVDRVLEDNVVTDYEAEVVKELLKYYSGELKGMEPTMFRIIDLLLRGNQFDRAEFFNNIILGYDDHSQRAWLNLCLIDARSQSLDIAVQSDRPLNKCRGFDEYCALATTAEKNKIFSALKAQKAAIYNRRKSSLNERINNAKEKNKKLTQSITGLKDNKAGLEKNMTAIEQQNKSALKMIVCFFVFLVMGIIFTLIGVRAFIHIDAMDSAHIFMFDVGILSVIVSIILLVRIASYELYKNDRNKYYWFHIYGIFLYGTGLIYDVIYLFKAIRSVIYNQKLVKNNIHKITEIKMDIASKSNDIQKNNNEIKKLQNELNELEKEESAFDVAG